MKLHAVPVVSMLVASAAALGCQLLYEKTDLSVATGGSGGTGGSGAAGDTTTSPTTGGGGSGGTTTTGGSGGTTSMGGTGGSGAAGGTGGMMTSTGGTGGTGAAGGTGGTGGSTTTSTTDTCDEPLFAFATSATEVMCATFTPAAGWTPSIDGNGSSTARPAAALVSASDGVGLFYQGGASGPLRAVELAGGACGAPADVPAATTKAAPSAAVLGGAVQALFQGAIGQGTDHPFVAAWDPANKWGAPAQLDMNVFSPSPAALATSGAEMIAAYGGGDDNLYRVRFAGGAWQLPAACFKDAGNACEQVNKALTPAAAGLDAGGWLVVFQDKASPTQLRWLTATAAGNTPSQALPTAASASPVALARTSGGAVLGFRGTNDKVYAAVFDAANGTWGAIQQVGTGSTTTTPAVAAGVCTHAAEIVYIDAVDGSVRHASLEGGTWSAPVTVGGAAMKGVALAGLP